jgi:hypothetical protein
MAMNRCQAAVTAASRKLVMVSVAEVVAGDWINDRGVFRTVVAVTGSVLGWSLWLRFESVEGLSDGLTVPVSEVVSVWRACS